MSSSKQTRCSLKSIFLECAIERCYESSVGLLIKVILLTIQIRAAGRVQYVGRTGLMAGTMNLLI